MSIEPAERRPRLLKLLGWALTDFDVPATRSYLEELEADRGLPAGWQAQVALHRGAFEVLAGRLARATRVFRGLLDTPDLPEPVRAEAARGLTLVGFEQLAPPTASRSEDHKATFWRFIDVLIACERGERGDLDRLVRPLDRAPPRSTYLATAHALGRVALAEEWQGSGGLSSLVEARAAVEAAADQGPARLATACWILGVLEGLVGSRERGVAALLEAERLLHPDTFQALSARGERALLLLEMNATDRAAVLASEVLEHAEYRGAHLRAAVAHAALAEVARRRSRPGEAESRSLRALELLRSGDARGILRRLGPALGLEDAGALAPISHNARPASLEVPAPSDPRVERVLARIRAVLVEEGNRANALSAAALARHAGWSREHLTRSVTRDLGMSLRELIVRERLAAAVARLGAEEPADAVALALGWSDARALRRTLLRVTGTRLRELRSG